VSFANQVRGSSEVVVLQADSSKAAASAAKQARWEGIRISGGAGNSGVQAQ
jgi:hypothetical protein